MSTEVVHVERHGPQSPHLAWVSVGSSIISAQDIPLAPARVPQKDHFLCLAVHFLSVLGEYKGSTFERFHLINVWPLDKEHLMQYTVVGRVEISVFDIEGCSQCIRPELLWQTRHLEHAPRHSCESAPHSLDFAILLWGLGR